MNYMDENFRAMREDNMNANVLTMAFVNVQPLESLYDTETGFSNGTIFPNINKPLRVGGGCK